MGGYIGGYMDNGTGTSNGEGWADWMSKEGFAIGSVRDAASSDGGDCGAR